MVLAEFMSVIICICIIVKQAYLCVVLIFAVMSSKSVTVLVREMSEYTLCSLFPTLAFVNYTKAIIKPTNTISYA